MSKGAPSESDKVIVLGSIIVCDQERQYGNYNGAIDRVSKLLSTSLKDDKLKSEVARRVVDEITTASHKPRTWGQAFEHLKIQVSDFLDFGRVASQARKITEGIIKADNGVVAAAFPTHQKIANQSHKVR